MKAVFQRLGAVAWGHSVAGLLEELAQKLPVPEALLDAASELDKAYIPSRYPDALPEGAPFQRYRRGEAERLLGHAEAVYAYCEGVLSQMDEEELLLRLEEGLKALEKEVPLRGLALRLLGPGKSLGGKRRGPPPPLPGAPPGGPPPPGPKGFPRPSPRAPRLHRGGGGPPEAVLARMREGALRLRP